MAKKGFHTVVCFKVVPRPEEVKVNPENNTLDRNVRSIVNPHDMNALEAALAIKDKVGGKVSILSMGPPNFEPFLRLAMSLGADHAYLLSDRALGGADTLATTYTLAKGIEKIGDWDLVICGEESSDGATASVPPGLAEWLDAGQATQVLSAEAADEGKLKVRREVTKGHEDLLIKLPAVISTKGGMNEPRFIDFDRKTWADETKITVWSAKDLDVEEHRIGWPGSPTTVDEVRQLKTRERKKKFIAGDIEQVAKELAKVIKAN